MHITIVGGILIRRVLRRRGNGLGDNDTDNQTVDTQNTSHDNGDNITNDTGGVVDTHVADTESGTPSAPGGSPRGENHAHGGAHVATEVVVVVVDVIICAGAIANVEQTMIGDLHANKCMYPGKGRR